MKRLLFSLCVLLCASAQAQTVSDVHTLHVFMADGNVAYETEGQFGTNGPLVQADGFLVVRVSDSLRVMVVIEADDGIPGTDGPNAAMPMTWHGTQILRLRPRHDLTNSSDKSPTYHRVSVFVCTASPPPPEDVYVSGEGSCLQWSAVPPIQPNTYGGDLILEVNDGLLIYGPAPPPYVDPPTGDPIDPE